MKKHERLSAIKNVILVSDQRELDGITLEIQDRLQTQYQSKVHIKHASEVTAEELFDHDLVLIASGDVPTEFRLPSVPMIILEPKALGRLGMIQSNAHAESGLSTDSNFINVSGDTPQNAGVTGQSAVLIRGKNIGWGIPGNEAIITATAAENQNRATIFSYDSGTNMFGFKAPHRRIAFLVAADRTVGLTQLGWKLFDATVSWAVTGTKPNNVREEDPQKGCGYIEGKPTKVLEAEEYRNWVEEKVANRLFQKYLAIGLGGGVGGIVTILAVYAWLSSAFTHYVDDHVKFAVTNQVTIATSNIVTEFDPPHVDKLVDNSMANLFFHRPELNDRIIKIAEEAATNATERQRDVISHLAQLAVANEASNFTKTTQFIASLNSIMQTAAALAIETNKIQINKFAEEEAAKITTNFSGIITPILLTRLQDSTHGTDQRTEALRLLIIFADSPDCYHQQLINIITNNDAGTEGIKVLALSNYESKTNDPSDPELLKNVLTSLQRISLRRIYYPYPSSGLHQARLTTSDSQNLLTTDEQDAYTVFLSRFSDRFATNLSAFITTLRTNSLQTPLLRQIVENALVQMKGDQPSIELAALANRSDALRTIALRDIARRQFKISDENNRRGAISNTWCAIRKTVTINEQRWQSVRNAITATNSSLLDQELTKLYPTNRPYEVDGILGELRRSTDTNPPNWIYVDYAISSLIGNYYTEQTALEQLLKTNDWLLINEKLLPQAFDDPDTGNQMALILLEAWQSRLSENNASPLFGRVADQLLTRTNWLHDGNLSSILGSSLKYYQGTNQIAVITQCYNSLTEQLSANFTNATARVVPNAVYVAVSLDSTNTTIPYQYTINFISNCVSMLQNSADTNQCFMALQMLTQLTDAGPDAAQLLPILETNLNLLTNNPICSAPLSEIKLHLAKIKRYLSSDLMFEADLTFMPAFMPLPSKDEFKNILKKYDQVISIDPSNFLAYQERALTKVAIGEDLNGAEADTKKSVELCGQGMETSNRITRAGIQENLSLVYIRRNQWSQVLSNCAVVEQYLQGTSVSNLSWTSTFKWIAADKLDNTNKDQAKTVALSLLHPLDIPQLKIYLPTNFYSYLEAMTNNIDPK